MMRIKIKRAGIFLLAALAAVCVYIAFAMSQAIGVSGETEPFRYAFSENGIDGTNFSVWNNAGENIEVQEGGIIFKNDFAPGTGARIAGNNKFVAPADSSEPVFDVTFSAYDDSWAVGYPLYVGVAFGLPTPESSFSEGTFVGTGKMYNTVIFKGVQNSEFTENYSDYTEAWSTDITTKATFRVVGYSDGTVKVYRDAPGTGDDTGDGTLPLIATHTDCATEGYIGFGVYNLSGASAEAGNTYFMTLKDFSVSGQIEKEEVLPELSVVIGAEQFSGIAVGIKDFQVSADVSVITPGSSGTDTTVEYSVVSGNAQITKEGLLTINGEGEITLRAVSVANPECFGEVTFMPRPMIGEEENVLSYTYEFAQSGVDGINFDFLNNDGALAGTNNDGVFFRNEYGAGTGARLGGGFAFVASQNSDTVFDVTFAGYYGSGQVRDVNIYTGLAFGLSDPSDPFSEGGFIGIGIPNTSTVYKGVQVASHRYTEGYAEGYNERITLRVVGKKDGTVTVYRGFTMPNGSENIEEVLASYEGMRTDGYIAFGVYNLAGGFSTPFDFTMSDFNAKGQVASDVQPQYKIELSDGQFAKTFVGMPAFRVEATLSVAPAGVEADMSVVYSVVNGEAEITSDGMLTILGAGEITIRASAKADSNVFDEVTFTPDVPVTAEETLDYVYSFSQSGIDGINFSYLKDENNFSSSSAGMIVRNEYGAGSGARAASEFPFVSAADGAPEDVVFDISFAGYFEMDKVRWVNIFAGLAFGLPSPDADFSEGTFIGMSSLLSTMISNDVQNDHEPTFPVFAEFYNERVTFRIVGQKNGTVTVYRSYTMTPSGMPTQSESLEEVFAIYTGCRVDGYVAFGIYNRSDFSGEYSYTFTDFSVRGTISADTVPNVKIEIEEREFPYTFVGMPPFALSARVDVAPGGAFTDELTYSVTAGDASVTENGVLTIEGEGAITVRATSVANPDCYDEVTFTPRARGTYAYEKYTVADEFYDFDEGIWVLDDPYKRTSFGAGFDIRADYMQGDYTGAKAVSKVRFSSLGEGQIVFDMTVRSYGHQRYNYDDRWGFAFALPEQDSGVNDAGVGFLWMSTIGMGLTVGGRELTPAFVAPYSNGGITRYLDSAVYADTYAEAFQIRLIAYKDGTLELYRTQAGHESINELKARWTGLDFNGYVALATCSPYNEMYTASSGANFREFSITGTALDDGTAEIAQLSINKDIFLDVAQVEPPLALQAFVTAVPSFDKYKQVNWEVISGPASISEGYISFNAPGEVTIKATARENPSKSETYTFTVKNFTVESVTIDKTLFEDVTNFTQPIELEKAAALNCSLKTPKYNLIDWEVVSGPAAVQGGRLRILGTGTVTVRAIARYDTSKTDTVTFRVRDYYDTGDGFPVLAVTLGCAGAVVIAGIVVAAVLIIRRKKKNTGK